MIRVSKLYTMWGWWVSNLYTIKGICCHSQAFGHSVICSHFLLKCRFSFHTTVLLSLLPHWWVACFNILTFVNMYLQYVCWCICSVGCRRKCSLFRVCCKDTKCDLCKDSWFLNSEFVLCPDTCKSKDIFISLSCTLMQISKC